jgi:hypothetical protein
VNPCGCVLRRLTSRNVIMSDMLLFGGGTTNAPPADTAFNRVGAISIDLVSTSNSSPLNVNHSNKVQLGVYLDRFNSRSDTVPLLRHAEEFCSYCEYEFTPEDTHFRGVDMSRTDKIAHNFVLTVDRVIGFLLNFYAKRIIGTKVVKKKEANGSTTTTVKVGKGGLVSTTATMRIAIFLNFCRSRGGDQYHYQNLVVGGNTVHKKTKISNRTYFPLLLLQSLFNLAHTIPYILYHRLTKK